MEEGPSKRFRILKGNAFADLQLFPFSKEHDSASKQHSRSCPHVPASPMRPSWMQRLPPLLLLVSHIHGAIGWLHLLDMTSCSLVSQIVGG